MTSSFHESFYSYAKYYNIAFDFKDVPAECQFIEEVFKKHSDSEVFNSFIEFGAGPALHCLEMAKTKSLVTAVDLSKDMTDYAASKARSLSLKILCECQDMITYKSARKYDVATLLMDSTSYLLSNEDVVTHLQHVAEVLNPSGLYILEMNHPKSVFGTHSTTASQWEMNKDGIKVKVSWGADEDHMNPITQITEVSVKLEVDDNGKSVVMQDKSPQRCFTATEFDALVKASGVFHVVAWYGSMNLQVPFDNSEKAWRMVPVLKKI